GQRTLEEIATVVAAASGRPISANNVRLLIAARLLPLGLIAPADGVPLLATSTQGSPRSLLAITWRLGVLSAQRIDLLAGVLPVLFWPPMLVLMLLLAAAGHLWFYFVHGLLPTFRAVLQYPLLVLGVEAFVLLSAVFHEFGHASALRYGGGRARGMG